MEFNGKKLVLEIESRQGSCSRHGEFVSQRLFGGIWSRCPLCVEEAAAEDAAIEAEKIACERAEMLTGKILNAGIPKRFMDRTLESFVVENQGQSAALAFAKEYADTFDQVMQTGRSVIFSGKPGTGKTHISVGIAIQVLRQKKTKVMFCSALRLIRRVKDTWGNQAVETETQAIAAFASVDLLIIDEIGQQFGSDVEKMILFDILNERYENRLPTILLSNLMMDDSVVDGEIEPGLTAFLGERVIDRFKEDGGKVVPFTWQSYRGKEPRP